MSPDLLQELITILEKGVIDEKTRFKILEQCYLEKHKSRNKFLTKTELYKFLNEVQRLGRIGTPDLEITKYINSI